MSDAGKPLFSVVIPTHDDADLLPRAVASVLAQTITDLEVIVVDDAGPGGVTIPPDPRVRVVRRSTNGGAGASRNTGADLATGRYLAFLDGDDVWVPHRLELALAGLARASIAVCGSRYADEPPRRPRVLDGDVADVILDAATPRLDVTALERALYVPHDERYRSGEDVEWWLRQAATAPVATVPRTGAVVRRSAADRDPRAAAERVAAGRRIVEDNRDWFRAHPRAAAMRWQGIGADARQAGDVVTARTALRRSFRLRPGVRSLVGVLRSGRALRSDPAVGGAGRIRSDRLRILQVVTDTDRRGAQIFATDLGTALATRGHAVTTVALGPGRDAHTGAAVAGGDRSGDDRSGGDRGGGVGLDVPVLGPSRLAPSTLAALRRAARGHDVVVAHGSSTLPACAVALAGSGVPFVYRQISDSLFWAPDGLRRARVRAFLSRAAGVVALAPHQADVLRTHFAVPAERVSVVPNGVPAAAFPVVEASDRAQARAALGIAADAWVVLSISALVPEKGVDLVIDAVRAVDDPSVHLLIAGDGPERAALERHAADLGGRVVFAGVLADSRLAYATADVMVLASRGGDSMPATLVEAAFCGVPVVATPVGSITEVVVDGDTGIVVGIDDVASLARAVRTLLDDPIEARALAVRARLRALQRFDIAAVAEQWEEVLVARARTAGR